MAKLPPDSSPRRISARCRLTALLALPFAAAFHCLGAVLIDINRATLEELMTLPGIQEPWARAILRNRPYSNKAQLLSRKVLSPAAYRRIRALIVARQ